VIGEYLGRVYDEVRRRPSYIVGDAVGFARGSTLSSEMPEETRPAVAHVPTGRARG
jgi:hypothetical protein